MPVDLPGYLTERRPSGRVRHLVRKEGDKRKRIVLPVGPEDPDFLNHYESARRGEKYTGPPEPTTTPESLAWLMDQFEDWMEKRVQAGLLHPSTLQQRRQFYARLREPHGNKDMRMPPEAIAKIRDDLIATPGAADNMVKALRAMFAWACHRERGLLKVNPATGIEKVNQGKGAVPWTVQDLQQYRDCHPRGTPAHLALSLFMFTACRISDAVLLGPKNETRIKDVPHLDWVPAKKGSSRVIIPIMPPLQTAIDAATITGPTYLVTERGVPFNTTNSFDNRFRKWIIKAGLYELDANGVKRATRSSHGIRKATGHLLALEGASQYHIMAIHGHAEAKTSEIYTHGVSRQLLALEAMDMLSGMRW